MGPFEDHPEFRAPRQISPIWRLRVATLRRKRIIVQPIFCRRPSKISDATNWSTSSCPASYGRNTPGFSPASGSHQVTNPCCSRHQRHRHAGRVGPGMGTWPPVLVQAVRAVRAVHVDRGLRRCLAPGRAPENARIARTVVRWEARRDDTCGSWEPKSQQSWEVNDGPGTDQEVALRDFYG